VAALQSVLPEVGCTVQPLLQSGHPPTRAALATLVNEVGAHPVDVNLVLDDYHLADSPEVADGMMYLLDHQPPNLHVVVITRADPELPLARLRARGELVEIRARDLRFTVEEVAAFLDRSGHVVGAPQVATLAARTEGWAAALRLASLSMEGRDDVAAFVAGFAGDDRYLIDYLVEEVLSRQPDDVRDFLLSTAVLDRLTGDLCDALTGRSDGATMLQTLERANLFVIPLDDRRRWYRYHHLFSDVLRAHLDEERPTRSAALHRRASDWYAAAGDPVAAVQHALAAGQADRAADIVETVLPAVRRERREAIIRVWVDQIPDDVVRRRPVLAIGLVGGLMQANEFDPAEPRLREVEHWLPTIQAILATDGPDAPIGVGPPDPAGMTYLSREELARVPAAVQMYRAALALVHGDLPLTLACAGRCTAAAMPDDHLVLGGAAALSGLARWAEGELEAAASEYRISIEHLYRAGHLADVLGCTIALADIRVAQGRLGEAERAYREGLDLAGHGAAGPLRGAADMHVGLAELALERGDTESARTHLEHAHELGESLGLPQLPHRLRATSAALAAAEADPRTAVDLLTAAEQVYLGDFSPDVRPLRARRARVLISLGEVDAALRWADERRLTPTDDLTYLREFEHVTLAEVLLAQHRRTAEPATLVRACALLGRLLPRAEDGGRVSTVLDLLILTGLAAAASGDEAGALDALRRAVVRAEPTGHVRVFARHGATLLPLLDRMPADDDAAQFVGLLRSSCRAQTAAPTAAPGTVTTPAGGSIRPNGLVEPLSPRELEVLRLLASDLDGPEMARRLFVSLNTLRTHTKHIYAKLGVTNRRAAVRRAQELDLPLRGRANRSA
jgi:ATP/maltotriose-dependent transcriptional regulator MalT